MNELFSSLVLLLVVISIEKKKNITLAYFHNKSSVSNVANENVSDNMELLSINVDYCVCMYIKMFIYPKNNIAIAT